MTTMAYETAVSVPRSRDGFATQAGIRQEVRFCSLEDGSRIAYASLGKGPPLVMVPGWLSHLEELWKHPWASATRNRLCRDNRLIWYDRLGCGLSDRGSLRHSLEHDVAELKAVLDAAGITRCTLFGYSLCGPVAAAFAARHPERVHRLVLCSTFARGSAVTDPEQINALRHLVRANWDLGSRTLASMLLPNGSSEDLHWFSCLQRLAAYSDVAEQFLDHVWNLDVRDLLPEIRVPTLVVHSRHDPAVPVTAAEEIAALLPDACLEILEGNEHDPLIRGSRYLVERVLAFVHGQPPESCSESHPNGNALTRREQEVLKLIARGAPNKVISSTLGIAVSTVERHVTNIYGKLDVCGRANAAMRAVKMGLVPPDTF